MHAEKAAPVVSGGLDRPVTVKCHVIRRVHCSAAESIAALASGYQDPLDDDLRVRPAVLAEGERFNGQCGANGPPCRVFAASALTSTVRARAQMFQFWQRLTNQIKIQSAGLLRIFRFRD